jgi:hypothetical protein
MVLKSSILLKKISTSSKSILVLRLLFKKQIVFKSSLDSSFSFAQKTNCLFIKWVSVALFK